MLSVDPRANAALTNCSHASLTMPFVIVLDFTPGFFGSEESNQPRRKLTASWAVNTSHRPSEAMRANSWNGSIGNVTMRRKGRKQEEGEMKGLEGKDT